MRYASTRTIGSISISLNRHQPLPGFNTQMKPFNDRRVRRAFNYAVNKKVIVREIARMGYVPAVGALPLWLPGMIPTYKGTTIILPRPESFWLKRGIRTARACR